MNKKIIGILICLLLIGVSTISVFGTTTNDEKNDTMMFEFSFSLPNIEKVEIHGDLVDKVTITGLSNTDNYQDPCLPVKPLKILLPQGTDVQDIYVLTNEKTSLGDGHQIQSGGRVIPLQAESSDIQQVFANNKESSTVAGEYILRVSIRRSVSIAIEDFSILHVNLYPVEYNLKTGELCSFTQMRLIVHTTPSTQNTAVRRLASDYTLVADIVENPSYIETYTHTG